MKMYTGEYASRIVVSRIRFRLKCQRYKNVKLTPASSSSLVATLLPHVRGVPPRVPLALALALALPLPLVAPSLPLLQYCDEGASQIVSRFAQKCNGNKIK